MLRGIDISPVAVEQANADALTAGFEPSQIHYEVMDAENLTFPDQTFDLVFGSGILHHLDLGRAIPELARVLKPNGSAVFLEPMGHNPFINLYRRLTPKMRTTDEHPLRMDDFSDAGQSFEVVKPTFFALTIFAALPWRRSSRHDSLIVRFSKIDAWLFRKLPRLRRFGWIAVTEMRRPRPFAMPTTMRSPTPEQQRP